MSWADEYFALVNKKKKEENKANPSIYHNAIRGGAALYKKKQSGYFSKGALEDGITVGNVLKTLHGTAKDVEQHLVAGALNIGEGFVDTAAMLAEGAAHLIGDKTTAQGLKDFRGKNIIDEQAIAQMIVGGIPGLVKSVDYNDTSVLGDRSDRAIQSLGQMAATAGLAGAGVPWQMTTGITSFGSASEQAAMENAGYGEAVLSSLISAGAEILSESLFGGSGLGEKGLINVDGLTRGISNRLVKVLADYGLDMATEGAEEVFSEIASNLGSALYREEDLGTILASQEALDGYLESFVSGALIGFGMNLGKAVDSAKTKTDYRTGLNETEQKVFDKLYKEASEGKTKAEQSKIYNELMEQMEKGYISTDTIEEALGDRTAMDALQKESDEFDKLYNTASNQLSKAQSDRLAALEAKNKATPYADAVKNAKGELSQKVYELAKGTKLEESYREKARRGQAFQADVSRYDAKQKAIVQKAMDSGVLNNTRRTHEFVDMIAKIGAEKGISFDFTNNEKLKASGFALDGKTVNGFVSGGNVTLNIHSAKALNSVVGHEIAHVLEGTELYDSLKQTLFDYAKTKGEYQGRYDALAKLYENVKDANIEGELVADLVGDYIFSDADFVKNLSTGNRNVFQKIFDEIKYLAKVATKGSKEARELEKVKKIFEEAYRSEGNITEAQNEKGLKPKEEIQYSLARDTEFSDNAIALNEKWGNVSPEVMEAQKTLRERVAARLKEMVEKRVALPEDKEGDTFFSNSSYGGSEENTTICPRSLASEAFMNAVSEMVGRPLSTDEQIYVSQDLMNRIGSTEELRGKNLSLECVYCYVAMDRKAQRQFLGEYIKQRDAVLEKLDSNVDTSGLFKDHQALAEYFRNKKEQKPNLSEIGKAYQEFLNGRKPTKSTYKRFKMWVDAYKNGTPMIDGSHLANMDKLMGDLNEFGDELKPQIADALDYAQKASWAKKRVGYVAYNGHILKWKQNRINKLNSHYGLRMYSFSDFHPAFVLENMQMITDASVRGLKMLGYTKDIDFVEIFAPSGMNINISTFGFEAGGNVYENNIMGAEWAKAQELRAKYPNVGVTFVATNDATVRWAMEQEWIDVVIPFHMVKTGAEVAKHYGFDNYTGESSDTKTEDWKKGNKSSIAPTEHNNDLETYLKALAENNLEPRFQRFMTNEDGTPNPNYMKLVNECRQSASESKPVQPKFGEEAIQRTLAKLEAEGYYNPIGGTVDRMYEIAAEVAENMTRDIAPTYSLSEQGKSEGVKYSLSDSDGKQLTKEQQEYFKNSKVRDENGNLKVMYHGTSRGGFTVFDTYKSKYGLFGTGFYFTDSENIGESYTKKGKGNNPQVYKAYLNIKNPMDMDAPADPAEWATAFDEVDFPESGTNEDFYRALEEYYEDQMISKWEVEDIIRESIQYGMGYDGITHMGGGRVNQDGERHRVYIAFQPEQIKNVDNLNPTENEDIRYSLSNIGEQVKRGRGTYGEDIMLAPVKGTVAFSATVAPAAKKPQVTPGKGGLPYQTQAEADIAPVKKDVEIPADATDSDIIQTVKDKLNAKIANSTEELESTKLLRDWVSASYAKKIADVQAKLDAKKNKDTKEAVRLKNRIENLKRVAADLDADLAKRISDIESRIAKTKEKAKEPPKKDILEVRYERINRHLEADKAALAEEYAQKKAELQKALADKDAYISNKATELYNELRNLKKGVRASEELGYLLDHKFDWADLKTALINVKHTPGKKVNVHSAVESLVREALNESYENRLYDLNDMDSEYEQRVKEMEAEAEKERERVRTEAESLKRSDVRQQKLTEVETELNKAGFSLDDMLDHPKRQLSTLETVDTMPQRVMEKTFGYKAGQALADATVNKVAQNETKGIRWLDAITNRKDGLLAQLSKKYHIKSGSKESAAAQMYAEGFYVNEQNELVAYTDKELAKDFPNDKVQKNIKGLAKDTRIRQFYDQSLEEINASRVRNGYPPIPKLDNYYLHFRSENDFFSKTGLPFNPNDAKAKDLPTDLAGQTADLKPGQPFFASGMHRKGKRTSFDLLGGMERYANSAKNQIFHIDDIQTLRALQYHIAERYGQAQGLENLGALDPDEMAERIQQVYNSHLSTFASFLNTEANILAGKTSMIDRALSEGVFGRRVLTFLDAVNKQFGSAVVGGNVSSAGTNLLPAVREMAISHPADSLKAFAQTVANIASNGKFDSFRDDSSVYVRRKGADRFYRTPWQKAQDPGFWLMGAVDSVATEMIARTEYNKAIREGKSPQQAHYESDKKTSRLMADRSLGQMPQMHTSRVMQLVLKFQLEVRNDLDSIFYDTVQEAKVSNDEIQNALERNAKTASKVAGKLASIAIASHLFGTAFESIAGYNPAFDMVEAIMTAFGLDDDEDDEDTALDNLRQGTLAMLEDMPYASLFLDGGRIPMSSMFPDLKELITGEDEYGKKLTFKGVLDDVAPYLLPTGGGQIKKTIKGLKMFDDDLPFTGSYTNKGDLRYPVAPTPLNVAQAALFGQYANKNAREYFDEGYAPIKTDLYQFLQNEGVSYEEYRAFDEDQKEAWNWAKNNPTGYVVAKAVAGDPVAYKQYTKALSDLKADKDESGNAISGSRKEKVLAYINGLDASYGEKIVLYKMEYPSDDRYNRDILEYIKSRTDLSYQEKLTICKELGFTVRSDGYVTWD